VNNFHEKTLFNTENFWAGMLQAVGLRLYFNLKSSNGRDALYVIRPPLHHLATLWEGGELQMLSVEAIAVPRKWLDERAGFSTVR
jgi:hypothetical protein